MMYENYENKDKKEEDEEIRDEALPDDELGGLEDEEKEEGETF